MMRRAAGFIVRNGPVSPQDRWEEDPGYSPFTLGAPRSRRCSWPPTTPTRTARRGVAAVSARDRRHLERVARRLDVRRADTALATACGVDGYYVRVAEPDEADAASPKDGFVPIKNRPPAESSARARRSTVSPDALALVRFGLRAADDPRIVNTVKVIDALLKVETPHGPAWRRYNGDGYGEHDDGSPFDGTGIGRPWPLLTGERAHYELGGRDVRSGRASSRARCERSPATASCCPSRSGTPTDIPERELFAGGATGSARPLVWAHAEYVKLRRSIQDEARVRSTAADGRPLRDRRGSRTARFAVWRFNNKIRTMPRGRVLRIETHAPSLVHWRRRLVRGAGHRGGRYRSRRVGRRHRYRDPFVHAAGRLHLLLARRGSLGRRRLPRPDGRDRRRRIGDLGCALGVEDALTVGQRSLRSPRFS